MFQTTQIILQEIVNKQDLNDDPDSLDLNEWIQSYDLIDVN